MQALHILKDTANTCKHFVQLEGLTTNLGTVPMKGKPLPTSIKLSSAFVEGRKVAGDFVESKVPSCVESK
jgi:hypothetical protein